VIAPIALWNAVFPTPVACEHLLFERSIYERTMEGWECCKRIDYHEKSRARDLRASGCSTS
jgi:hypothetical protein